MRGVLIALFSTRRFANVAGRSPLRMGKSELELTYAVAPTILFLVAWMRFYCLNLYLPIYDRLRLN